MRNWWWLELGIMHLCKKGSLNHGKFSFYFYGILPEDGLHICEWILFSTLLFLVIKSLEFSTTTTKKLDKVQSTRAKRKNGTTICNYAVWMIHISHLGPVKLPCLIGRCKSSSEYEICRSFCPSLHDAILELENTRKCLFPGRSRELSAAILPEMTSKIRISARERTDGSSRNMAECDWDEMFLRSEYDGPVLPWDRFRRWVTCFCIVTFDLELGQALEVGNSECFIDVIYGSKNAQSCALKTA